MDTRIRIILVHNLEHMHKGTGSESLDRFLSNEEQWTYNIYVDDLNKNHTIAFSLNPVCPLGDDKKLGTKIYRTRKECERALFEEFDKYFSKYGSFQDAEIEEEEREFGKEAA